MLIVSRRNTEIVKKCSSSVDETQKSAENARRRPTKCRIYRKSFVIRGWKWKNGKNHLSSVDENAKNIENRPSSMDESEKMTKNGFPPRRTSKKQQKYHFRRGWKVKNEKNCVSAAAESYKTAKTAFPPRRTNKKWQKQSFSRGRNPKIWHFQAQGAFRRLKTQGCLKEKMSWHLFWGYSFSNMFFQYAFLRHSFSIYRFNMPFEIRL